MRRGKETLKRSSVGGLRRYRGQRVGGFALYEVMLGLAVFVIGVLALGRSVENCMYASSLSAEEDRVRQILSNRMAEIQASPGNPESGKKIKFDSGYGMVEVIQKSVPANLKEADGLELTGINAVTLTAEWTRGGTKQSRAVEFYVYRGG